MPSIVKEALSLFSPSSSLKWNSITMPISQMKKWRYKKKLAQGHKASKYSKSWDQTFHETLGFFNLPFQITELISKSNEKKATNLTVVRFKRSYYFRNKLWVGRRSNNLAHSFDRYFLNTSYVIWPVLSDKLYKLSNT